MKMWCFVQKQVQYVVLCKRVTNIWWYVLFSQLTPTPLRTHYRAQHPMPSRSSGGRQTDPIRPTRRRCPLLPAFISLDSLGRLGRNGLTNLPFPGINKNDFEIRRLCKTANTLARSRRYSCDKMSCRHQEQEQGGEIR
jgi:hypothetical protein